MFWTFYKAFKGKWTFKRLLSSILGGNLDGATPYLDLSPPAYPEISKIIHNMKSKCSGCPLDHVSAIALTRCPILRFAHHHIIVYCWQNNIIPETWERDCCVLIYKKDSPKQSSNSIPITLESVRAKVPGH